MKEFDSKATTAILDSFKKKAIDLMYEFAAEQNGKVFISLWIDTNSSPTLKELARGSQTLTLNITPIAISNYRVGENHIAFSTRFSGVEYDLVIPLAVVGNIFCPDVPGAAMDLPITISASVNEVALAKAGVVKPEKPKPTLHVVK